MYSSIYKLNCLTSLLILLAYIMMNRGSQAITKDKKIENL